MHPPLRIDVPDEERATSLCRALQPHDVEAHAVDGHFEVRVDLIERNPEHRVGRVLTAIDQWLLTADLPYVQVHLDGSSHTLHPPVARSDV
jgi:hypothetical protein